jgi:hypothetical protein
MSSIFSAKKKEIKPPKKVLPKINSDIYKNPKFDLETLE